MDFSGIGSKLAEISDKLPSGIAANIDVTNIFAALYGGTFKSIAASFLRPAYYIRFSGQKDIALEFDGLTMLRPNASANITTAPVEGGSYQSINKVRQPGQVMCSIIVKGFGLGGFDFRLLDYLANQGYGHGLMPQAILAKIKILLDSTNLYDIETPKETFVGYDLINTNYQVTNSTGVSMLTIQLTFQEVLQRLSVTLSGSNVATSGTKTADKNQLTKAGNNVKKANPPSESFPLPPYHPRQVSALPKATGAGSDIINNMNYLVSQLVAGLQ